MTEEERLRRENSWLWRQLRKLLGIRQPDPETHDPGPSVPGGVYQNPGDGDRRYDQSRKPWPKR